MRTGFIVKFVLAMLLLVALMPKSCAQVMLPHRHPLTPFGSNSTLNTCLLSYWALNETSGTRADSSGNTNTLWQGSANTYTTNGLISNCLLSPVATTSSLMVGSNAANANLILGDTTFTISAWFKAINNDNTHYMIAKSTNNGSNVAYALLTANADSKLRFRVTTDGSTIVDLINNSFGAVSTNVWHNVVAWHDPTLNQIFMAADNGTVVSNNFSGGVWTGGSIVFLNGLYQGGENQGVELDEVGIWCKILTSDERTEIYNAGAGKACCPF